MVVIMDGRALAEILKKEMQERVDKLKSKGAIPTLATILIGDEPSSKTYVRMKEKDCQEVGILFRTHRLAVNISKIEIFELIDQLNADKDVHGILLQLPLPVHLNKIEIIARVAPEKDVDGLHPINVGKLWLGMYNLDRDLLPCTPKGIVKLLDHYQIKLTGKNVVIINRSDLVGKPLLKLLLDRNATVTTCHSKTTSLKEHTKAADILITAVGQRPTFLITADMVKDGAVVVDVGINYVEGKICGDVDFESVKEKASYITPVPGGVGPMTRAMLLENILIAATAREGE
jgi:methylenetetrahydrofolate dehydrogenase (NADP+)/methenyltetrahydrofolate cyclohydrolase